MTWSLTLACLWAVIANLIAMTPSKDNHWRNAYILIGVGIPILGFVTIQHGPWLAMVVLVAGGWMLRWPVIYLVRWIRRVVLRQSEESVK